MSVKAKSLNGAVFLQDRDLVFPRADSDTHGLTVRIPKAGGHGDPLY